MTGPFLDDADQPIDSERILCTCGHELCEHSDLDGEPCDECNCHRFREAEPDFDDQDGAE